MRLIVVARVQRQIAQRRGGARELFQQWRNRRVAVSRRREIPVSARVLRRSVRSLTAFGRAAKLSLHATSSSAETSDGRPSSLSRTRANANAKDSSVAASGICSGRADSRSPATMPQKEDCRRVKSGRGGASDICALSPPVTERVKRSVAKRPLPRPLNAPVSRNTNRWATCAAASAGGASSR